MKRCVPMALGFQGVEAVTGAAFSSVAAVELNLSFPSFAVEAVADSPSFSSLLQLALEVATVVLYLTVHIPSLRTFRECLSFIIWSLLLSRDTRLDPDAS